MKTGDQHCRIQKSWIELVLKLKPYKLDVSAVITAVINDMQFTHECHDMQCII